MSSLREDTVIYKLFPSLSLPPSIDILQYNAVVYSNLLQPQLINYIWNYEPFKLSPAKDGSCLIGSTCYHGNVEDEWFVVKLLVFLTSQVDGLVVSVTDNDGQFLLIESAHYLPKWLKPETAENRVFIYEGQVHIIPQPRTPGEVPFLPVATPTLQEGVALVRNSSIDTMASSNVQKCIQNRLQKCVFPLHCAHVNVPLPAANILINAPQLISSIIHALVERDKDDMKCANKMKYFSPQKHPMVLTDIQFPRLLYAMLVSDKLTPPIKKGAGLQSSAHLLGAKITCGLEILATRYGDDTGKQSHTQWVEFIKSLHNNGYFDNEIEGSLRYNSLMETAREYYDHKLCDELDTESSILSRAGQHVQNELTKRAWSLEEFNKRQLCPPDDDSWLNIKPNELDEMLKERGPHPPQATPTQLDDVSYGVKSFVNQISSLEGAEFPWSADDFEPVELSSDQFVNTLEEMFSKMEAMSSDSENESFYSSSSEEEEREEREERESSHNKEHVHVEEEKNRGGEKDKLGKKGEDYGVIHQLMSQMDEELSQTTMADSFKTVSGTSGCGLQPVDIDFNLVQNILDNYSEQLGEATPTSNILNTLGLKINSSK